MVLNFSGNKHKTQHNKRIYHGNEQIIIPHKFKCETYHNFCRRNIHRPFFVYLLLYFS